MLEFTQIVVLHNPSHICYKMHKKLWGVMFYSGSVLLYILYVYTIFYMYILLYILYVYTICVYKSIYIYFSIV